jgi:hypothetical protein
MELAEELFHAFGLKEDPSKNDITIVKRGLSVELTEARDISGHIQFMTGKTNVSQLKELLKSR